MHETPLVSNLISATLEDEPDIEVVGCATTAEEALTSVDKCDILLVSTRLSEEGSLSLTHKLSNQEPDKKIIVIGLTESREQILRYIESGADGYVLKDDTVDELVQHIRAVNEDRAYVSPEIARAMMDRLSDLAQLFSDVEAALKEPADLTPREQEILELLGQGLSNREISSELVIEVGTVKNHVHSILQKLDVENRHEAAAYLALVKGGESTYL